jgi:hypothetical protein
MHDRVLHMQHDRVRYRCPLRNNSEGPDWRTAHLFLKSLDHDIAKIIQAVLDEPCGPGAVFVRPSSSARQSVQP